MIFNNHEQTKFDDPRPRRWIFGLMWAGSVMLTGGMVYGIYVLQG